MKTGSILQGPIEALERDLKVARQTRETIQTDILKLMEDAAKADDAIKGYNHALAILQRESDTI